MRPYLRATRWHHSWRPRQRPERWRRIPVRRRSVVLRCLPLGCPSQFVNLWTELVQLEVLAVKILKLEREVSRLDATTKRNARVASAAEHRVVGEGFGVRLVSDDGYLQILRQSSGDVQPA